MDQLRQEVALLAVHLHWSYQEIMRMEHRERSVWVQEALAMRN